MSELMLQLGLLEQLQFGYITNIMVKKHPGFKAVQGKIEGEGYSKQAAGAILANATRNASAKAKKANPALKKVKGK